MPESLIALAERLGKHSTQLARREGSRSPLAADLRFASVIVRKFASLQIAEQARLEPDDTHRRTLEREAADLWCWGRS